MAELFALPNLDYFSFGNPFTGSVEPFRYRIEPEQGMMKVEVYLNVCYEKAEILEAARFPLTEEGRACMLEWLAGKQRILG